ncbi:MAG TPA: GNAT family N-acetyltransferase [Firmicutes bacterium]|nr:GNAT family N-acetyltransferase [Bacillota bacterium]
MQLRTDQLFIREATQLDAPLLCQWWNNGAVMAHAGFPNGLGTTVDEIIEKIEQQDEFCKRLIMMVDQCAIGEMIYKIHDQVADIGIKICVFTFQEKGYGTEALHLLLQYLFAELGVEKVIVDTNLENKRAQHVYEKVGFKKVSIRMNSWRNQLGQLQSSVHYEIKKQDYTGRLA